MNKIKNIIVATVLSFVALAFAKPAFAATQTISVPVTPLSISDPLADPTVAAYGNAPLSAFSSTTSPSGASSGQQIGGATIANYPWKVDTNSLCQGAVIQSLALKLTISTSEDFDMANDGVLVFIGNQGAIVEDASLAVTDGAATTMASHNIVGGVYRGYTFSTAGPINATWSSPLFDSSTMTIHIIQDTGNNMPTQWLESNIENAQITYDDSACAKTPVSTASSTTVSTAPTLASTGASQISSIRLAVMTVLASVLVVLYFTTKRSAKRL
jgi:hypothetical protein